MDFYNTYLLELIRMLNKLKVEYIIIGGFATNYYGYQRATGDIDFWIHDTLSNREKLIAAFKKLEYGFFPQLKDLPLHPGILNIYIADGVYVDIMDRIMNFEPSDFLDCYSRARVEVIDDTVFRFIHLNDHLQSKKNSPRLKDQLDYNELIKLNIEE